MAPMPRNHHARIEIDASLDRVWEVMLDTASYGEWNPFVLRADCARAGRSDAPCACSPTGASSRTRDDRYRVEDPDNADLEDVELWLVGESPEGLPLLLVVAPVGGSTAVLRYFRTLGAGPAHSNARYLGTAVLVEKLARRGVVARFARTSTGGAAQTRLTQ